MRIESDFHDYYDCMMRHGFEPRLVYERRTREVQLMSRPRSGFVDDRIPIGPYMLHQMVIGFCGHLYPAAFIHRSAGARSGNQDSEMLYCIEDLDKIVAKLPIRFRREYDGPRPIRHIRYLDTTRQGLTGYFAGETLGDSDDLRHRVFGFRNLLTGKRLKGFFKEFRVPTWVVNGSYLLTLNPRLSDFEFFRVVSTEQAYQELAMYMASVLAIPEKPIPVIDDRTMAEAKGFDKHSFRKEAAKRPNSH